MDTSAFLVIALSLMLSASGSRQSPNPVPTPSAQTCTSTQDDAAIYSSALYETLLKESGEKTKIVLLSQTSAGFPPGMAAWTSIGGKERKELLDAADAFTKSDFDAKTKLRCDLSADIEPVGRVVLLSAKQEDAFFPNGAGKWEAFEKKYPHAAGLTLVSAIGFNTAHDQALLYVGNSCGDLCGSGYFVLLTKTDGKWVVEKTANIWVS